MQLERRGHQPAQALILANAGQQIEEVGNILAELRAARQQPEIGVKPRGRGVVIARGQVHVAADMMALPPHHQAALGVNLVAHQPIDHVHARLLKLPRPEDVVRLVEPRPQLHHRRHLFAVADRVLQRADDAPVPARAVKRLLDRQHVRVRRRQLQELHHAVEALVRMMQQDVPLANGGKQVRPLPQAGGHRRYERRVAQLGRMIPLGQRHEPRRVQRAVNQIEVVRGQPQAS